MITDADIKRINELYLKSKSEGLLTKALPIATRSFWQPEILSTFFPKMSSICNTIDIADSFSFNSSIKVAAKPVVYLPSMKFLW